MYLNWLTRPRLIRIISIGRKVWEERRRSCYLTDGLKQVDGKSLISIIARAVVALDHHVGRLLPGDNPQQWDSTSTQKKVREAFNAM